MTANEYLSQSVNYGGMITSRGAMLADLQQKAAAVTDDPFRQAQLVNAYLGGHARTAGGNDPAGRPGVRIVNGEPRYSSEWL